MHVALTTTLLSRGKLVPQVKQFFAAFAIASFGCSGGSGDGPLVFELLDEPGTRFSAVNEGGFWSVGPGLCVEKGEDVGLVDPSFREPGYTRGGVRSGFTVEGDFTITVDFSLMHFPQPATSTLTESILGVISEDGTDVFWVLRFQHQAYGNFIEAWSEPARQPIGPTPNGLATGRYRIIRDGATFTGQFAESGTDSFATLGVLTGGHTGPMHVELLGRQGGDEEEPRSAMEICFGHLIVEADFVSGLAPSLGS